MIAPGLPGLAGAIHCNGIFDRMVFHLLAHAIDVFLAVGFRRVDAEDDDAFVAEIFVPTRVPRVIVNAVDSAKGPKMEGNDFAA